MMDSLKELLKEMDGCLGDTLNLIYKADAVEFPLLEYFKECLRYNVSEGKKIRGLLVISTYKTFAQLGYCDGGRINEAIILAWAVEILQGAFLVLDDLMDHSPMRRGKPSWYIRQQNKGFGLIGINDGIQLFTSVERLIINLYEDKPADLDQLICFRLLKLFNDISFRTCMGQSLDMVSSMPDKTKPGWLQNSMESNTNRLIMAWKTSFYTYYLPIAAGMILANVNDNKLFDKVRKVTIKMGEYFQTQDDYLDAFADPSLLGKEGTDIQECKCSWLICQALQLASPEQIDILSKNYGRTEPECVQNCKQVYKDLDLTQVYEKTERQLVSDIEKAVETNFGSCQSNGHSDDEVSDKLVGLNAALAGIFKAQLAILYKRSR